MSMLIIASAAHAQGLTGPAVKLTDKGPGE
jgi:hypothetical protein